MPVDASQLSAVLAASQKKLPPGRTGFGSEVHPIKRIPWPSLELTLATWGGAPMGRVIRLWGSKHTAKSLVVWGLVKAAQEYRDDQFPDGLTCTYINAEKQFDPEFTRDRMGVDIEKLGRVDSSIIEEITFACEGLLEASHVIIIDSIGQCTSRQEYEFEVMKGQAKGARGSRARAWGQFITRIVEKMDPYENMLVVIDQVRVNQDYGQEIPSGSAIWAHNADLDLHHKKTSALYRMADGKFTDKRPQKTNYETLGNEVTIDGFEIGIEVEKSRVCRPHGKYRGRLDLDTMQWDRVFELKKVGLYLGTIKQSGSYFTIDGDAKSMQGNDAIEQRIVEDGRLVIQIYQDAERFLASHGYGRVR